MQRRAAVLWAGFGLLVLIFLILCALATWLILGPYGPPLPWRQTPGGIVPTASPRPTVTAGPHPTQQPTAVPPTRLPPASATPIPVAPTPTRPTAVPPTATVPATAPAVPTLPPYPEVTAVPPVPTTTPYPAGDNGAATAARLAQAVLPPRDLVEISSRLLNGGVPLPRTVTPGPQPLTAGRQDPFWLSDPASDTQTLITATLKLVTEHLYMYVENGVDVDQQALEEAARAFEEQIYPTDRETFGSEWTPGVDGDPHIVILHALFHDAAGYFSSLNEVPRQVSPHSNQREMFCMATDGLVVGSPAYLGTLAHEFEHMIHWSRDPLANAWVNEGMAQMAEQVNGYDPSEWAWLFASDTDVQLTAWAPEMDQALPHYAASYLWFRYFTDRLGGAAVLKSLLDPQVDSVTAIERALAAGGYRPVVSAPRPFDAFFADWVVANYVNSTHVGDGRYAYAPGLELGTIWPSDSVYALPWDSTPTVYPYATDYIAVEAPQEGTLHIAFDGGETLPLVNATPHSGTHFWWSNRGDQADTTLTRAFDLHGVSQATLRYWLWYDIEKDYDYAYVEASTDGGNSWTILPGPHTTGSNPNGNSLGRGYTGASASLSASGWVREQVDLSAYVGREVFLRFELITDDGYDAPGLALDDLEIPEIGFADDVETDTGWEPQGFVWVDNTVPLTFLVQVVTESATREIAVQPLLLDAGQRGEVSIPGYGRQITRVTLVVSAVAPATTEPATYRVQLNLE